jgi:predicted DNA-binding helix-hairpin-helix protein
MDAIAKMGLIAGAMQFEPDGDLKPLPFTSETVPPCGLPLPVCDPTSHGTTALSRKEDALPIVNAAMPGGRRMALLKTLQTSACERDCYYCCFRAGRDSRRTTLSPDEMAQAFIKLNQARAVEGLFLSSGIAGGGVRTQDRIIATAEILRFKLGFKGYLHLKIMPGAEFAQVERTMQLANRVSVNLEAPNTSRLAKLAPHKVFMEELLRPLKWIDAIRCSQPASQAWNGRWPSTTTQFVVGAAGESDLELMATTSALNRQVHLSRAYFSGFNPIQGTPLENLPPNNPWREHRLYQASFLLRDYGFDLEELPFAGDGNLPLGTDPKLAWARVNLSEAPIEINRAERHELLRIPGIGPKTAQAILAARRLNKIRGLTDLRSLGIPVEKAAPFLLLDGQRTPVQLTLFVS